MSIDADLENLKGRLHTFKVMPKRWVVERSFAWLEKPTGLLDYYSYTGPTILNKH